MQNEWVFREACRWEKKKKEVTSDKRENQQQEEGGGNALNQSEWKNMSSFSSFYFQAECLLLRLDKTAQNSK